MKSILLATLVLSSLGAWSEEKENFANPEATGEPIHLFQPMQPNQQQQPKRKKPDTDVMQFLKNFGAPRTPPPMSEKDVQQIEKHYKEQQQGHFQSADYSKCAAGGCPFEQTAKECGEHNQRACQPGNFGGRTMCGLAVARMIACMKSSIPGASSSCTGSCGHGKMFVDCQNNQMKNCGYQKVDPNDNRCKLPGAVLAYTQSPTERGQMYGHVEFVCGRGRYCSVYGSTHERPWPKPVADGCWYPQAGN